MANEFATRTLTTKPIQRETLYEEGTNERVQIAVSATGGTFTITFGGATTAAIAYNAAASTVETALEAIDPIDSGDVDVTGGPGNAAASTPYVIEFTGDLANTDVGAVTTNPASLTGGSGTAVVTVLTAGADGSVVAQHLTDVVTDPESEDAVQTLEHSEYPSANQTGADALSVHEEDAPSDVFND